MTFSNVFRRHVGLVIAGALVSAGCNVLQGDSSDASSSGSAGGGSPSSTTGGPGSGTGGATTGSMNASSSGSGGTGGVKSMCAPDKVLLNPPVAYPLPHAGVFSISDVDKDGKPDLVALDGSSNGSVSVLKNKGDGTFGAAAKYLDVNEADAIAVADFDGDGYPDIMTGGYAPQLSLLLNKGDGTFHSEMPFDVTGGGIYYGMVAADFDGNGSRDVAAWSSGFGGLQISMNSGKGVFSGQGVIVDVPTDGGLAVADLDKDGAPDLVSAGGQQVCVLWNQGGLFSGMPACLTLTNQFGAGDVILGDLDGDGLPDLVVLMADPSGENAIEIFRNKGGRVFDDEVVYSAAPHTEPDRGKLADVNNDGKLDLLIAANANQVQVFLGNGDGTIPAMPLTYSAGDASGLNAQLEVGDFLGNGLPGIAVMDVVKNEVDVMVATCKP